MGSVTTTMFYDGQFWIALIEKTEDDGTLLVGKYLFGQEPSNGDILDFYLNRYDYVPVVAVPVEMRIKHKRSKKQENRSFSKAREAYGEEQRRLLAEGKRRLREKQQADRDSLYKKKRARKKQKHRGR